MADMVRVVPVGVVAPPLVRRVELYLCLEPTGIVDQVELPVDPKSHPPGVESAFEDIQVFDMAKDPEQVLRAGVRLKVCDLFYVEPQQATCPPGGSVEVLCGYHDSPIFN